MPNQSLWEWASKKPEETLRPARSIVLSAFSSIEGATAIIFYEDISGEGIRAGAVIDFPVFE